MDYSVFKLLQFVLFFGAVFAFGIWQLRSLERSRRQPVRIQTRSAQSPRAHRDARHP